MPSRLPSGEIQLPNGRLLTPTGTQTAVGAYPFGMEVSRDGKRVVVASTGAGDQTLSLLDAKTGTRLHTVDVDYSWLGLALAPDGTRAFVSGAKKHHVLVFRIGEKSLTREGAIPVKRAGEKGNATPSGLAISRDGASLWVARMLMDDVVRIDVATQSIAASVVTGHHPYRPVLSPDGGLLAVSNWGAASVTLVDPAANQVLATIATDDHPGDLVFSPDGKRLFVAQANRNRVALIDVVARAVVRQISIALGPDGPGSPSAESVPDGSTPNALALSRDGRTLYVANADDDAVAVVDVPADPRSARAVGFIPSGWYPCALALAPDGKTLFIANAKGSGSRANAEDGPDPTQIGGTNPPGHVKFLPGSISRVAVPDRSALAKLTARAYANRKPAPSRAAPRRWPRRGARRAVRETSAASASAPRRTCSRSSDPRCRLPPGTRPGSGSRTSWIRRGSRAKRLACPSISSWRSYGEPTMDRILQWHRSDLAKVGGAWPILDGGDHPARPSAGRRVGLRADSSSNGRTGH